MLLIHRVAGTSCIAGQDENGTLALVTNCRSTRRGVLVQKVRSTSLQALLLAGATMSSCCRAGFRSADQCAPPRRDKRWCCPARHGLWTPCAGSWLLEQAAAEWRWASQRHLPLHRTLSAHSPPSSPGFGPRDNASLFYWSIGNVQLTEGADCGLCRCAGACRNGSLGFVRCCAQAPRPSLERPSGSSTELRPLFGVRRRVLIGLNRQERVTRAGAPDGPKSPRDRVSARASRFPGWYSARCHLSPNIVLTVSETTAPGCVQA